jgi:hypothetical protein
MAGPFWRRLEGMCEFAMRVRTPGGLMSQFGDWDSGRTIILDDSDVSDFASMFCTGAARFGRDDLKWAAGAFREEALWLMGPSAAGRFDAIPARPPSTTDRGYERGGFYTWRSDWTEQAEFALFKCSPFLGHTQADNLTLLYSSGGKDWLVDRGTFTYNGAWRWRTYFRHTAAHNAVCVDGLGQSLAHRAFRWLKHPRQEVHTYHSGEQFGYVAGRTSGFRHLASPVRHARSVLVARQRYVLVLDALFAGAPHDYALLWHVAPEHEVKLTGDGVAYTADATGANLWITAVGSSKVNAAVITGRTDPIQGWHSPLYGCKEPAPTVSYRTRADGPIYLATLMTTAAESMQPPALSLRFLADSERWGSDVQVEVEGPGFKERVGLPNPAGLTTGRFPQDRLWVERDGKRSHVIG